MRDYTKFLWLWIKKAFSPPYASSADFWAGVLGAIASIPTISSLLFKGEDMSEIGWKIPIFCFAAIGFIRLMAAPYLIWKEEKEKSVNGKKLRLTEDEKQTSCADFVTILFNDLFDNFSIEGLSGSGFASFGGRPRAHYAYRCLEVTAKNLLVDDEIVRSINSYLNYFVCEGDLGIAGMADGCRIKTIYTSKRQLDDNISKVRQEAKLLAEKIKDITR